MNDKICMNLHGNNIGGKLKGITVNAIRKMISLEPEIPLPTTETKAKERHNFRER